MFGVGFGLVFHENLILCMIGFKSLGPRRGITRENNPRTQGLESEVVFLCFLSIYLLFIVRRRSSHSDNIFLHRNLNSCNTCVRCRLSWGLRLQNTCCYIDTDEIPGFLLFSLYQDFSFSPQNHIVTAPEKILYPLTLELKVSLTRSLSSLVRDTFSTRR